MKVGDPSVLELLELLGGVIAADLMAVLDVVDEGQLMVRAALGSLSHEGLVGWRVQLGERPQMARILEGDEPYLREELQHEHIDEDEEPDTYDGIVSLPASHSCVVVPLRVGRRLVGAMTLDTRACGVYGPLEMRAMKSVAGLIARLLDERRLVASLSSRLDRLAVENSTLRDRLSTEELIGRSVAWRRVLELVKLVAPAPTRVFLTGETGTGKERVARAIHRLSTRVSGPFVAVNCAVLMPELASSQLFGHERGAFTGADALHKGHVELAAGGTLFLDEVAELPLATQAQLLRVLQEGTFRRLGGTKELSADVRLIVATHHDVEALVKEGRFRDDLFFRLNTFPIHLPPLRERRGDINLLASYLLRGVAERLGVSGISLSTEALACMESHDWPGNVRELENVLERAALLARDGVITCEHLHTHGRGGTPHVDAAASTDEEPPEGYILPGDLPRLHRATAREILRALGESRGKIGGKDGAAERLGVPVTTLRSAIDRFHLRIA
jgi:transcriptional regulator with GAF, ATPase, and Fis domain